MNHIAARYFIEDRKKIEYVQFNLLKEKQLKTNKKALFYIIKKYKLHFHIMVIKKYLYNL
ncbi:hypothetical protein HX13_11545 [Chryseobacterium sp. P1-3]|nr:hypothetical protein HX13_11545 [Chryseobacterium sp. P1-3]